MAESGVEALEKVNQLRPDAVILDVLMDKGNGFDTLVALRKQAETATLPVIILSVVDQKNVGFALGATDYLIKPMRKSELLETMHKHVSPQADDDSVILLVDDDPKALELLEDNSQVSRIRDPECAERCKSSRSALLENSQRSLARFADAGHGWLSGHWPHTRAATL